MVELTGNIWLERGIRISQANQRDTTNDDGDSTWLFGSVPGCYVRIVWHFQRTNHRRTRTNAFLRKYEERKGRFSREDVSTMPHRSWAAAFRLFSRFACLDRLRCRSGAAVLPHNFRPTFAHASIFTRKFVYAARSTGSTLPFELSSRLSTYLPLCFLRQRRVLHWEKFERELVDACLRAYTHVLRTLTASVLRSCMTNRRCSCVIRLNMIRLLASATLST